MRGECEKWGGAIWICPGDYVVVFLRGTRGIVGIRGKILEFGEGGFAIEDGDSVYFVRGSEVRLIKVLKKREGDSDVSNEGANGDNGQ